MDGAGDASDSEELQALRAAVAAMEDAFVYFDARDRLRLYNEPFRQLGRGFGDRLRFGMRFEDVLRLAVSLGLTDVRGRDPDAFIAERVAQHHRSEGRYDLRTTDGRILQVSERRTDDGGIVGIYTDLTNELRTAATRAEMLSMLEDAVSSLEEGFTYFDRDDRLVICNQAWRDMLPERGAFIHPGQRYEDILDATIARASALDPDRDWPAIRAARLARHRAPTAPMELMTGAGRWILISETRTRDGGLVGVYTDVTAIKRAEAAEALARREAERAARTRAQFIAVMSHEIRTPLNGVLGLLSVALDTPLDPDQRGKLTAALKSAEGLAALVEDVMAYSRLQGPPEIREPAPFDPAALLADLRPAIEPKLRGRPVRFDIATAPAVPRRVMGDASKLRRIATNIIDNAVKFTEAGAVAVRLGWRDADGGILTLTVTDTGPGIPTDRVEEAFQPFRQLDPSNSRRGGGAGLGLAICKGLVELLGGTIELESRPGEGSRFKVALPAPAAPAPSPAAKGPDRANLKGARVLVVEDSATNRLVCDALLERLGAEPMLAKSGLEALALAARTPFDLICMDIAMPDLDGLETTARLRGTEGPNRDTPVVAVTANAMPGDRERYLTLGLQGYIAKPLRRAELERELLRVWRDAGSAARPEAGPAEDAGDAEDAEHAPEAVLDESVLARLGEDVAPDALRAMVAAFLDEQASIVASLPRDVAADDWPTAARGAHSLKSAAANLGAADLALLAGRLERACLARDEAAARAALAQAMPEAARAARALSRRFNPT